MATLACCGVVLRSDADPTALKIVDLEPHRSQLAQSLSDARPGGVGCKLKPRSGPGCGMLSTGHPMAPAESKTSDQSATMELSEPSIALIEATLPSSTR